MSSEGLEVVLSPLQFAAILENESIDRGSCLSNRLWGTASVLGGAVELIGAAALLLTPEPTAMTKVAGGVLAVHGSDTVSSGLTQIFSCQPQSTLTSQGAAAVARALGADPKTAANFGIAIDVAVPLAAGFAGAARAIAIRRGAVSLAAEEAQGGHTIARHVGRTEAQLRARLVEQPGIPAASTFVTLEQAEQTVAAAVRANSSAIKAWAAGAGPGQTKAFSYTSATVVGQGVVRSTGQLTQMKNAVVVLRKVITGNRVYFVLTAYPKP
jgi:hypothetical protein